MKLYWQYMDEMPKNEVYSRLMHGLFADKLPPVFTMRQFLKARPQFKGDFMNGSATLPVVYDSMRNTNELRRFGIPDPFSYERLCAFVHRHWADFQRHFKTYTQNQTYKVSQLHIRRLKDSPVAFQMSYHHGDRDEDIIPELKLAARYQVKTDISKFFPSIYTHALSWAWSSKENRKANYQTNRKGFCDNDIGDQLDKLVSRLRDNETCGIPIGPHVSNLLSEMLMARIDYALWEKEYRYVRNIDDILCFVESYEKAERFLSELKDELGVYNLSINYAKTKISALPLPASELWTHKIQSALVELPEHNIERPKIVAFLDKVINLWLEEGNGAIVSYAMKALMSRTMTESARIYYVKTMLHLANRIPYLYPYLDERVFEAFDVEDQDIRSVTERMLTRGFDVRNYEAAAYGFFFSLRYGFLVKEEFVDKALGSNDCVLKTLAWCYSRSMGLQEKIEDFYRDAKSLSEDARLFQNNWLYCYEVLRFSDLQGQFKDIKKCNVSFLKSVEELRPFHTPNFEWYPIIWSVRVSREPKENEDRDPWEQLRGMFLREEQNQVSPLDILYLECIVANLICSSRLRRNVGIPRSEYKYRNLPPFTEDGISHDVASVKRVLRWLREQRFIGERRGTSEKGISTYWPKDSLLKLLDKFNLSRVKRWDNPPVVVIKDRQKQTLTPTPSSKVADRYRCALQCVNDLYAQHLFACPLMGVSFGDGFTPRLKAVFNNSSWSNGGRLYASATVRGYNYQCIPSDLRRGITIDGEKTAEIDFRAMHPCMLYDVKGVSHQGDYYGFLPSEDRTLAKLATLVMLNAKSRQSALGALVSKFDELKYANGLSPKKAKLRDSFLRQRDLGSVLTKASVYHKQVRGSFFRGIGLRLQNIESSIALEIISSFAKEGIPVLPVHDSFIIAEKYKGKLISKMKEAYHNIFPKGKVQVK